jgi:hypothetical protein
MLTGGPLIPDAVLDGAPEQARNYLYHSVRSATTSARVRELEPLARRLDARAGGHALADWVERSARDDFAKRAPFAETYRKLVLTNASDDRAITKPYLAALRAAGQSDLLLGAMHLAGAAQDNAREYAKLASDGGDPWYLAMAAYVRAGKELSENDYARAEATLRRALGPCEAARVEWRCAKIESSLAWLLQNEARSSEARSVALSGLARSRAFASDLEPVFLLRLAEPARLDGSVALVAAYARELTLVAPDDCFSQRTAREELTDAHLTALDVDAAVRELADAPRCSAPLALRSSPGRLSRR